MVVSKRSVYAPWLMEKNIDVLNAYALVCQSQLSMTSCSYPIPHGQRLSVDLLGPD